MYEASSASKRPERLPEYHFNLNPAVKPVRLVADPHLDCTVHSALIPSERFRTPPAVERFRRGFAIDLLAIARTTRLLRADAGDGALHVEAECRFFQMGAKIGGRDV